MDSDLTSSAPCGRTPRSRPDRTAIVARSNRNREEFVVESSPVEPMVIEEGLAPRSTPDHDPIATRSWRDRGGNRGKSEAKLKLKSSRFVADLKPRPMPKESPSRCLKTAPTNASIGHDLRANFSFKNSYSSSFVLNF